MKKLLSLLLVLSLSISLLGGSVLAADDDAVDAPFALTAVLNEDSTVTLSLRTTRQMNYGALQPELIWPEGFVLKSILPGADYAEFGVAMFLPSETTGITSIYSSDYYNGSTVDSDKELLTYTLDASSAKSGDYTFSVQFTSATDIDDNELAWQDVTIISDSITIETAVDPVPEEPVVRTLEIGLHELSRYVPYGTEWLYVQNEFIYDKSEVAASGTITALAFNVIKNDETLATDSLKIYMGCTDKSRFDNEMDWIDLDSLTLVYEGSPTLGKELGWETLQLDIPFIYSNSQNLVVAVCRESSSTATQNALQYAGGVRTTVTMSHSWNPSINDWHSCMDGCRPYIQLTFEPGACTHTNTTTTTVDNGDTHTISTVCNDCGADFVDITEEHTFDWEHAIREGDQYLALCTGSGCTANTSLDVTGKTMLEVVPATALEPGKVYVVTEPGGAYAMSVISAPATDGSIIPGVRHAIPVRVVNHQYIVFENDSESIACQWSYVEGNCLRAYSESNGCDVYLRTTDEGTAADLSLYIESSDTDTDAQYAWTYSDGILQNTNTWEKRIFFRPVPVNNGGLYLYGTSPCFSASIVTTGITVSLYEVVGAECAHYWVEDEIVKEPTCTEEGVQSYYCANEDCDETKTEPIPATGHTWADGFCTVCGEPYDSEHAPERDADGTYLIGTAEELAWLSGYVNEGVSNVNARLTADIQVDASWTWIGSTSTNAFGGEFDGGGHTVTFNETANGLFRYVAGANIHDVTTAGSIMATAYIAPVAVYATETAFTNCVNNASVASSHGNSYVGGIVCYVKPETTTGQNLTTLTSCVNHGAVQGAYKAGGIVGYAEGGITVSRCLNTGAVTSTTVNCSTGGVLGETASVYTTVTESTNTGAVTGMSKYIGGFIGAIAGGNIKNCYNTGNVSSTASISYVGGFLGYGTLGAFYNCYNAGTVTYSSGTVYATRKAPFTSNSLQGTVSNCYYLDGCAAENTGRGTVKTADELKALAPTLGTAYTDDTYEINQGYPILTWQLVEPSEPEEPGDELGVTVEVHKDYMGGYSLILVYGEAAGYLYGENAMYRTPSYDDDENGTAFAYIISGTATESDVRKVLSAMDTAAVGVTVSDCDVNASGTVDISDVQAVADCYNIRGDLAKYMPVYLRADVNADYVVNSADAELVLDNRS